MKSHELAQLLLAQPDVELICQKDSEGNGYSPLAGVDFDVIYIADSSYGGEVYSTTWTADEADADPEEWEQLKRDHAGYAVLFPVN